MPRITFEPAVEEPSATDEIFDQMIERGLRTFAGEIGQATKAANIIVRWLEQDPGSYQSVVHRLVREHIEAKIREMKGGAK